VRLVFAGTPEPALPALDALVGSQHEVAAVVTRPDAPRGRGRTLHPSPVAARAAELGIEVLKPARPRDPEFVQRLTELAPDCCPVVAYGALIPQHVLDIPAQGWVNLHFSLLPAWRGAAPVQHALIAGDEVTGASTFRLVAELDAGPVYATVTEVIGEQDTAGDLLGRLAASGAGLLVRTLDGIADGSLPARPQPDTGVTFAPKINVDDARIDWALPAAVIGRLVRGCTPAPGAWTTFRGERFKISATAPLEPQVDGSREVPELPAGRLHVTRRSVWVGTGSTALELRQVQAQGKKPMAAADWARGLDFAPGEALG
jgi:methionyl-tRNA formyltransferase